MDPASRRCVPCEGGVPWLGPARIDSPLEELGQGWSVVDGLGWGRVRIRLWTHASDGLTGNDPILAAKISEHARS